MSSRNINLQFQMVHHGCICVSFRYVCCQAMALTNMESGGNPFRFSCRLFSACMQLLPISMHPSNRTPPSRVQCGGGVIFPSESQTLSSISVLRGGRAARLVVTGVGDGPWAGGTPTGGGRGLRRPAGRGVPRRGGAVAPMAVERKGGGQTLLKSCM